MEVTSRRAPGWALALLAIGALLARHAPARPAEPADPATAHPVWCIGTAPAQLLLVGSWHLLDDAHRALPPALLDAMANSERLVIEADPRALRGAAGARKLNAYRWRPLRAPGTVYDRLDPAARSQLHAALRAAGLDPKPLEHWRLGYVLALLSSVVLESHGYGPPGVEQQLLEHALRDERAIETLETIDQQLQLIAEWGDEDPSALVRMSLAEQPDAIALRADLQAWRSGLGAEALSEQLTRMREQAPADYAALISERNNAWLAAFDDYLADPGRELVAVGALHLHGPDGLLSLLRARGMAVARWRHDPDSGTGSCPVD